MNINCQGVRSKTQELATVLEYTKPDIICGTESWLNGIKPGKSPTSDHIKSAEIFPDYLNVYRNDRNSEGGGVFILVHKTIISEEKPEHVTSCEIEWVKVKLRNLRDLYIGAFYMPKRKLSDIEQLKISLDNITKQDQNQRDIILVGDFNCPMINWETNTANSSGEDQKVHQSLINVTTEAHLTQVQLTPTRGPNILDLVFVSNPSLVKSSTSIPGVSDHDIVITDLDTKPYANPPKPRKCLKFSKANWEKMRSELNSTAQEIKVLQDNGADANTLWLKFKTQLQKSIDTNIPSFMLKKNNSLPWLSPHLKKMLRKKQRMFKKARSTRNWSGYREYQKYCRRELRKAEWQYINGKILQGLEQKDNKPFWRYIKAKKQDNTGVAPLKDKGKLHSDSQAKADILLNQFKSVFTEPLPPTNLDLPAPANNISQITISTEGVIKLLKNLHSHKAPGPDNLPNLVLKTLADQIGPSLAIIYQVSLNSGKLPQDWLSANVSCAFKKGDRHLASNYRPISLTSVPCKILEHIVCRHILCHLETNNILTDLNHGFRSGYSTETQLLITTQDLLSAYDNNKQVDMAILDFSKAFDTVPHDRLLAKLSSYGICGSLHNWLCCFLTERSMQVVVEGISSKPTTVDSGVPQGTVLGPLLFLCHINDLPAAVSSQVRLFADDCLIYREVNEFKDHYTLQRDLKNLEDWAEKWGMRFNATKCYIMTISKKPSSSFMYQLNNTILQNVSTNPYLGILFSSDMKWNTHINNITKKASSTLGFIKRNLRRCPTSCKKTAYLALVRPLLEYGAIIWDPYQKQEIDQMERIQRKAVRFISRDFRSNTPGFVTGLLKKHNLPTLQERRQDLRLTFLYKVVEGLVPAIPPEKYLTPQKPGRQIRPRLQQNSTNPNPIQNLVRKHNRCYVVPTSNTVQFKNSFFPKTIINWNNLDSCTVNASSTESFKTALAVARRC